MGVNTKIATQVDVSRWTGVIFMGCWLFLAPSIAKVVRLKSKNDNQPTLWPHFLKLLFAATHWGHLSSTGVTPEYNTQYNKCAR